MPMLHIDHQHGIALRAGVAALEPVVEPTYCLIAPLDLRPEIRFIGEGVIPWADDRFDRRFGLHEHVGNVVAVAVLHAADQKARNRNLTQGPNAVAPEWSIVLMLQIK